MFHSTKPISADTISQSFPLITHANKRGYLRQLARHFEAVGQDGLHSVGFVFNYHIRTDQRQPDGSRHLKMASPDLPPVLDALIIGLEFSGTFVSHKLLELDYNVLTVDLNEQLGGV